MPYSKWSGQTETDFKKNYDRVRDIISKSDGDVDSQIKLAKTQANRITDEIKALNRSMAAKEIGNIEIFEVFFNRAFELGSVSKQDYREYKLSKLGL
jgi:hypothetical protein